MPPFPVEKVRAQFPSLARQVEGLPAIFLDGPGGSQVPERVIEAVAGYLRRSNANSGGVFATSRETDQMLAEAHAAAADLVGAGDPGEI
nr:aminotransferase class V-fold PLP-dependent enzyme [Acidobacteriota bacterium]